jgi:hypothetical protein
LVAVIACDEEYKLGLWMSALRSFLHSAVTSSHVGPNIPLSVLFSNNPITVLHVSIFIL